MSRFVILPEVEELQGDYAIVSELFDCEDASFVDPYFEKSWSKETETFFDGPLRGLDFSSWIEEDEVISYVNSGDSVSEKALASVASVRAELQDVLGEVCGEFWLESPSVNVCGLHELKQASPRSLNEAPSGADHDGDVCVDAHGIVRGLLNPGEDLESGNLSSPLSDSGISSSSSLDLGDADCSLSFLVDLLSEPDLNFVAESNKPISPLPSFDRPPRFLPEPAIDASPSAETLRFDASVVQGLTSELGFLLLPGNEKTKSFGGNARSRKRVAAETEESVAPRRRRTGEQRKRKMRQNRDAAIRYRERKKGEAETMFCEADELEEANKNLRERVDGLKNEIEYLKALMLDVIGARLAKSSPPLVSPFSAEMFADVLATS